MRAPLLFFVALATACDPGAPADASLTDGATICRSARDCSDGLFCDGLEVCAPGAPGADVRGCVDGEPPCGAARCSETGEGCEGCVPADADGDGHDALACGGDDCDDSDAERAPGRTEVCDLDGRDEDCAPETLGDTDRDGDGHVDATCCNGARCGDDCDDSTATIAPGVAERCDGLDQDCDGSSDEGLTVELYEDRDRDGFGSGASRRSCEPIAPFTALRAGDCDDDDDATHPLAAERCDGRDEDCSGVADDGAAAAGCFGVEVVDAACVDGACVVAGCNPGFDDCNDDPTDGCERSLATITDCGECGRRCEDPRGTAACIGGVCDVVECNSDAHRCGTRCVRDDVMACGPDCVVCPPAPRLGTMWCQRSPDDPVRRCRVRCAIRSIAVEGPDGTRCEWTDPSLADLDVEDALTTATSRASDSRAYGFVAWVPRDVTERRVLVRLPVDAVATVTIDGAPVTPEVPSAPLPLALGENRFAVEVVAEHGERRTYDLRITRGWDDWHYLKSDGPAPSAALGSAVAASETWLVAGAPADDTRGPDAGRALVYAPTATGFRFVQALTAPNAGAGDRFGASVAVSGDVIVVGAPGEASLGAPDDDSAPGAGAAYVYRWNGSAFALEAYLKATTPMLDGGFGSSVAIAADVLVVAAPGEPDGPPAAPFDRGVVHVFERGAGWSPVVRHVLGGYPDAIATAVDGDRIALGGRDRVVLLSRTVGWSVEAVLPVGVVAANGLDLSGDTLVVGSAAVAYVYERRGAWSPVALSISRTLASGGGSFGSSVSISPDGILVGAPTDMSSARGVGGDYTGGASRESGAAYLFRRTLDGWRQTLYVKAPNADGGDRFGTSVAWCAGRAVIGAPGEDGAALGVDGPMASEGSVDAGALYTVAP